MSYKVSILIPSGDGGCCACHIQVGTNVVCFGLLFPSDFGPNDSNFKWFCFGVRRLRMIQYNIHTSYKLSYKAARYTHKTRVVQRKTSHKYKNPAVNVQQYVQQHTAGVGSVVEKKPSPKALPSEDVVCTPRSYGIYRTGAGTGGICCMICMTGIQQYSSIYCVDRIPLTHLPEILCPADRDTPPPPR